MVMDKDVGSGGNEGWEGGDSELGGDGDGVSLARSLCQPSALWGKDMEVWGQDGGKAGSSAGMTVESAGAKCSPPLVPPHPPRPHPHPWRHP
ncbi:hypothetical protein Tco_0792879 [Tanacetum coccineum]